MKTTIEFLPTRRTTKPINTLEKGQFFLGTAKGIDSDHQLCIMTNPGKYYNFSTNEEMFVASKGLVTPVNVKILVDQN